MSIRGTEDTGTGMIGVYRSGKREGIVRHDCADLLCEKAARSGWTNNYTKYQARMTMNVGSAEIRGAEELLLHARGARETRRTTTAWISVRKDMIANDLLPPDLSVSCE